MESNPAYSAPVAPRTVASAAGVRITGVDIAFGDLVVLLIKLTLAYIPAMIVMMVVFAVLGAIFGGLFAGLLGAFM